MVVLGLIASQFASLLLLHKCNKRSAKIRIRESAMRKILRRQTSGYVLSFLLCSSGLAALFTVLWKTWPQVSSSENPVSIFWESLWTEKLDLFQGFEFKLVYLIVLAAAMLVAGVVVLALSRQWFLLAGEKTLFQCPFCRKQWKASPDKALVHCPHCRQLVHPQPVEQ